MDYTSTGTTSTTINIPVTNDSIVEEPESFNLSFSIPSSLSEVVVPGSINSAIGTITDNTGMLASTYCVDSSRNFIYIPFLVATVMFQRSTYQITEGDGPALPELILSNPSSTNITVQIISKDKTATGILRLQDSE